MNCVRLPICSLKIIMASVYNQFNFPLLNYEVVAIVMLEIPLPNY